MRMPKQSPLRGPGNTSLVSAGAAAFTRKLQPTWQQLPMREELAGWYSIRRMGGLFLRAKRTGSRAIWKRISIELSALGGASVYRDFFDRTWNVLLWTCPATMEPALTSQSLRISSAMTTKFDAGVAYADTRKITFTIYHRGAHCTVSVRGKSRF